MYKPIPGFNTNMLWQTKLSTFISFILSRCISTSVSFAFWANSVASSSATCAFSASNSVVSSDRLYITMVVYMLLFYIEIHLKT